MSVIVGVAVAYLFTIFFVGIYASKFFSKSAGRDLWGYPKKYAKITLEAGSRGVVGSVVRRGETLCRIELDLDAPYETPSLRLTPHLNTHILPRSDGPGILMSRVIARDTSPDFETKSSVSCRARVELKSTREDPWDALGLVEVLGGGWIVGDFHATDENGWGRVLDTYTDSQASAQRR